LKSQHGGFEVANLVRRTEKVAGQSVRQLKIFISRLDDG
jgi:hypothetical protein